MQLEKRKELLIRLGDYLISKDEAWKEIKAKAQGENGWFIQEFIESSVQSIAHNYLQPDAIDKLIRKYKLGELIKEPKMVGVVMAGNIPMVGFHDLLCVFLSGHKAMIKLSSKDDALLRHVVAKLTGWNQEVSEYIIISELLKNCDAYIATGSNNTSRYFEYYFQKYPHIIRKNRTSVAVLTGTETSEDLLALADDVYQYFGLGCRNVTKIYVPTGYDFVPLLEAFRKYDYLINHNKYKNNYDYQLAIHLLNNKFYMTNDSLLVIEDSSFFSPISQLNYEYYVDLKEVQKKLHDNEAIQCVVSDESTGFGKAQKPGITDFADGVDTMAFLLSLA
ncbi:MAG TPA: acyl-CoA reductase [Chitinophagaceae bacterium]|jgi:hypothetical protein|nr:acyl-CoA reductase [Chitinophagaceae bacterium]